MAFKTVMTPAAKALYPLRVIETKVSAGDEVTADQPALIVETADGRRIALKCSQSGRVMNTIEAGTVIEDRQMFMTVEPSLVGDPEEASSSEPSPEAETVRAAPGSESAPAAKTAPGTSRRRVGLAVAAVGACLVLGFIFLRQPEPDVEDYSSPEPGDYWAIAKGTCNGQYDGLKEMQDGSYKEKSTTAMMALRWLYVTEKCKTYIGFGPEASKPLMAAANAGDGEAAYTIGSYLLEGGGGFERDPKLGEQWLNYAVDKGNTDAATTLAYEYTSGKNLPQNLDEVKNLISWLKRKGVAKWLSGGLEMELMMKHSDASSDIASSDTAVPDTVSSDTTSTGPAAEDSANPSAVNEVLSGAAGVPFAPSDVASAAAATPNTTGGSNTSGTAGEKGDLVYTKMPLQRECWRYTGVKGGVTDAQITVMWQNTLHYARGDWHLGGSPLEVDNFFSFDVDVPEIINKDKWNRMTAVAAKLSFYGPNPPPDCHVTYDLFDSRDELLANLQDLYGREKPAAKLNWSRVPVPPDVLADFKSVGIVVR